MQISLTTVQPIAVDVVDLLSWVYTHDELVGMQGGLSLLAVRSSDVHFCVPQSTPLGVLVGAPVVLDDTLIILFVDESSLAVSGISTADIRTFRRCG